MGDAMEGSTFAEGMWYRGGWLYSVSCMDTCIHTWSRSSAWPLYLTSPFVHIQRAIATFAQTLEEKGIIKSTPDLHTHPFNKHWTQKATQLTEDRHIAKPVPSPVHRYKAKVSLLLLCCSLASSGIRPRTCARADCMTFRNAFYLENVPSVRKSTPGIDKTRRTYDVPDTQYSTSRHKPHAP